MNERKVKIVSIVGARPQFIKAAAMSRAISEHNRNSASTRIRERIVHTGQHYDGNMSQVFFDELVIPQPNYNLGVGSGSHGEQTGKMLEGIEKVLLKEKPDWCLVYGDTNSTLAGALVAAKLHIPVAHIEAGLRSFNRRMPEEINRILTDNISDVLFCPTKTAVKNLAREGISDGVCKVGDIMYDNVLFYAKKVKAIEQRTLKKLNVQPKSYYLATVHRADNTDNKDRFRSIFNGFAAISTPECPIILPLHPRSKKKIMTLGMKLSKNVRTIAPVSYLEILALESNASAILTDSGGVQKEAYWFHVPCITLRDETEWVEVVNSGWNILAGTDGGRISEAVRSAASDLPDSWESFHGDGRAARRICKELCRWTRKC